MNLKKKNYQRKIDFFFSFWSDVEILNFFSNMVEKQFKKYGAYQDRNLYATATV